MPVYYNLSQYSTAESPLAIYTVTDKILQGYFSLFLIVVVGIWITTVRLMKNDSPTNSIIIASFYSLLLAMALYASQVYYSGITKPGLYIFVPALVLVAASIAKWYNTRR